ncbi:alpha/beta fold hydrolase [Archangium lansingense]|uniref:Alpha/beta hydrolase n=1 Tax=Archangium lansingense TaxID=2995310 RepID=A0ABT3ZUP2_9BACT|nr:alpha/beta hydrolase [Archangium lansinium]MCY1073125.1 alpha/beta hydrolase [Archangium lansinium]
MTDKARVVESRNIQAKRLTMHTRMAGEEGFPVLFVHGNCSSSAFFESLLSRLPAGLRGIAPDLRGYGDTEPKPIDATRGMRDHSDDVLSLMDALGLARALFVAHSAGAGVVMQLAIDHPERVAGLVLEAPVSPYGFGGTRDADGTPCWPDFAGSGGGTANPDFVQRLARKERSAESQTSPRNVMNGCYVKPPFKAPNEEALLDSVLSTRVGDAHYPGTFEQSPNWPGVAPGTTGMNNSFSPKYFNLSAFASLSQKPDVLWIRGADDVIVSDTSLFDFGYLGKLGAIPGWPGEDIYPPQPMILQTRRLLERYAANGGHFREEVLPDTGHSPHVEKPQQFERLAIPFLREHAR